MIYDMLWLCSNKMLSLNFHQCNIHCKSNVTTFTSWSQHHFVAIGKPKWHVLCALFVVNHTFNATPMERLQQHPLLFTANRTDRTFFFWRLDLARLTHHGHSTILLQSESPSSMCAKLHTVAASNNRDNMPRSLYYCLLAPHIYGCSLRISRSWWTTCSTQHQRRGCKATTWLKL